MPTYSYHINRILPPLTSAIGLLALSGGIYGILSPQAYGTTLGISISPSAPSSLSLVSLIGARNMSSGLTILALLYTGQKKAVGTLLFCGVSTALIDAWICFQHDGLEGKAMGHALMGAIIGSLGVEMYRFN
jgi:hypothetical protein